MATVSTHLATLADIPSIEPLFNLYREFYGMESDKEGASQFLTARLTNKESIIIYAKEGVEVVGFTQLFPTFSSSVMKKVYILNDLFVGEDQRGRGVAKLLIEEAIEIARQEGCSRVSLSTAKDNTAQFLYEKLGFKQSAFKFYNYVI